MVLYLVRDDLAESAPFSKDYDATLVAVKAQLMNLSVDQEDQVLGLQMGSCLFVARFNSKAGALQSVPVGSELELSGVYVGHGGNRNLGQDIDSFELLLNSPSDIQILARPSWWTIKRMLVIVSVLFGVLVIALVWIRLLQRQVALRTAQLGKEIEERERIERQHVVEQERSRIARDLHDDLGSSLTEISLLADAGPGRPATLERAGKRFESIAKKARAVVNALDVIVWLVNPGKNQLQHLVGYLVSYAEEYFSASGITCRVRIPHDIPQLSFTAEIRHSLFLAVKEVLNNVVRHSQASEVVMGISLDEEQMKIVIADNGRGFDPATPVEGNGLTNLRNRLADLGGSCEIAAESRKGTKISLLVPLPRYNDV